MLGQEWKTWFTDMVTQRREREKDRRNGSMAREVASPLPAAGQSPNMPFARSWLVLRQLAQLRCAAVAVPASVAHARSACN